MAELMLSPKHADEFARILQAHLPHGTRVRASGSRAAGRGLKPYSDLDLPIDSPVELPTATLADPREALTESDLPFAVDFLDHRDAGAEFLSRLEADGPAGLRTLPVGPA